MFITFSIVLAVVGFLVYTFFGFKSADKTAGFILGLFLLAIPLGIYCSGIARKIGEKLPIQEIVLEQKEFPDCGVVIEKKVRRFKDWRHSFIANVPSPEVWEVCRQIE